MINKSKSTKIAILVSIFAVEYIVEYVVYKLFENIVWCWLITMACTIAFSFITFSLCLRPGAARKVSNTLATISIILLVTFEVFNPGIIYRSTIGVQGLKNDPLTSISCFERINYIFSPGSVGIQGTEYAPNVTVYYRVSDFKDALEKVSTLANKADYRTSNIREESFWKDPTKTMWTFEIKNLKNKRYGIVRVDFDSKNVLTISIDDDSEPLRNRMFLL